MSRYKALLAYEGTEFEGFQRQAPSHRTVQGEVEKGLHAILDKKTSIVGAGRTDSGVHATGQVISFTCEWRHPEEALRNALNANLPEDIAVLQIEQIHETFHPRFDAKWRRYEYRIYNAPTRQPLYRHRSWWVKRPLNITQMNQAAKCLLGEHDFATFGQPPQGNSTVRTVVKAEWQECAPYLVLTVEANAFLFRMVRSIVGSLKMVGDGSWSIEQFGKALKRADRTQCGPVAPPQGVYLVSVKY